MADDNGNNAEGEGTEGEGSEKAPSPGKVMRDKLEATLAENQTLKAELAVHNAGLGHLSPKQRNAAIRDATEDGAELTADSLKKSAEELGFALTPKQESKGGGEGSGEGSNEGEGEPDPVTGLEAIEQAQRRVPQTPADGSFEQKIANAKSAEEVEAIIRNEGQKVGIVLEADVE